MAAAVGLDPAIHPRVWVTGEYLLGYTRPQGVPTLIGSVPDAPATTGTNGQLPAGTPVTELFPRSGKLRYGSQPGVRARVGAAVTDGFGADVGGFYLSSGSDEATATSPGSPVLFRGYTRALDGSAVYLFASIPGRYSGSVAAAADTRAWGIDANARFGGFSLYSDVNDVLFGVRYLNLQESLTVGIRSEFAGGNVGTISDTFRTSNHVYVGQAGFNSRVFMGRFTLDLVDKFGVGGAAQRVEVSGRNTLTGLPDQNSGLYAQPGLNGVYERNKFVAANEFGVSLGFSPVPRVSLSVGYNILWVSSVARPGPAIDRVINDSQIRYLSDPPADPNSRRPAFDWNRATTDAWIQGLTLGVNVGF